MTYLSQGLRRVPELKSVHASGAAVIPVAELGLPLEGRGALNLGVNESGHNVTGVNVYRTDRHDLLAILLTQLSEQKVNQRTQLVNL